MASDRRITPQATDYSEWYNDVIRAADLVDDSPTRGAMVLKPNGYAIWERIKEVLDHKIKETGHKNAYFPLLVPKSLLQREASHVAGFALESAVVTHHRLKEIGGELRPDPKSKLNEEYIIRPTSEAIIYESFGRWIQSYRDLPLLINQWANVLRWEMRTRPFVRTSEFLWQEGHTAHATQSEAQTEQLKMLEVYRDFLKDYLAIDVIAGQKSESEKFAGADTTFTLEGMMQDGKALQCCTSHDLGQNFSKPFEITYVDQSGESINVWQTSWGLSTRIIGAIIMSHSDDLGLVLPPMIAPTQVVIIVLGKTNQELQASRECATAIKTGLEKSLIRVVIDDVQHKTTGERIYQSEKEGIPIRIEIGPRDLARNSVMLKSRIFSEKTSVPIDAIGKTIINQLDMIQQKLLEKSSARLKEGTISVNSIEKLKAQIDGGRFARAFWDGTSETEEEIKRLTGATIRCLPFDEQGSTGKCVLTEIETGNLAIFAKAY